MKEIAVAKTTDLQDGQMQQIEVEGSQILLSKINGKFYATGAFCTHYGAPLEKGIICNDKIVCPWHNACYNAIAGEQLEPPGLDSLPTFDTKVENENVLIRLPEDIPQKRTKEMANYVSQSEELTFVVLGAGAAGMNAVETLRQEGFQGKIVLVSESIKLPYDRTKLSKAYLQGKAPEDSLSLRSCEFYDRHDIELRFGRAVTKVDVLNKSITFEDNSTLNYDSLLLATGGKARKLDVPGANLANIFTIRKPEDVNSILDTVKEAKKAVVVGSSFIGMEAAASLIQQGLEVTVVSPDDVPFKKILGDRLGKMFQKIHEEKGVNFQFGAKVSQFTGNSQVEYAILEDGSEIAADLVIVGIGVELNTDYLENIELNEKDRSVRVNKYLQTEIENIYAAGDLASFPYAPMAEHTRIEHWRLAAQQGRIAATNMLRHEGSKKPQSASTVNNIVPFFWSGQYDLKLRYIGHAEKWDEMFLDGNLDSPEFLAFYLLNGKVMAVAGINRDKEIAAISELMRLQKMPDAATVKNKQTNWLDFSAVGSSL